MKFLHAVVYLEPSSIPAIYGMYETKEEAQDTVDRLEAYLIKTFGSVTTPIYVVDGILYTD